MMVLHLMTSAVLIMMVKLAIVSLASSDRKLSTQEIVTRGKGTKNVSLLLIRMELPDHLLSWEMEREKLWMMPNRPKHGGFLCRSFLLADTVWPSSKLSRIDIGGACRLVLRGSRYWSLSWMWRHILRHICRYWYRMSRHTWYVSPLLPPKVVCVFSLIWMVVSVATGQHWAHYMLQCLRVDEKDVSGEETSLVEIWWYH